MIPTKRQLLFILAAMCAMHIAAAFPIPLEEFEEIRPDDGLPGVLVQESQHNDNDKEVLYGEAFEGDMLMSKEDLEEFYGIRQSEKSENTQKRSIVRNKRYLWTGGNVYYSFDSSVSNNNRELVRRAMDTIEALTCLKFSPHTEESSYINIVSYYSGCFSSVGMGPGAQILSLGLGCFGQSTIIHELFHALGVFHEQSRPDRDDYVEVIEENIQEGRENNFNKRHKFDIDSQGVPYDYASIMHYRLGAFRNASNGLYTIRIVDEEEYERQGRPLHNYVSTMSKKDVTQINRLYNCPGSGVPGELVIRLNNIYAENLPSNTDAFVVVTAYDDQDQSERKVIQYAKNESLAFGNRISWQYIDIKIVDENDRERTPTQSFSVNEGLHRLQHRRLTWSFQQQWTLTYAPILNFTLSLTDNCNCFSGGSCRADGTCDCAEGFAGPHCEYSHGRLRIIAHNATNLKDTDWWGSVENLSDAFLEIQAYDHHGNITRKNSRIIRDSLNPVWDEEIDFGVSDWAYFTIQARDNNGFKLGELNTFPLKSLVSVEAQKVEAYDDGIVTFGYFFN